MPGILPISLQDAIDRGLKQNLGALLSSQDMTAARGTRWQELSALLPHVTATPLVDVSQVNLKEFGFTFNIPGQNIPSVVGPFSYFDARAICEPAAIRLESDQPDAVGDRKCKDRAVHI